MLCSQSEFTLSNEVASTRHVGITIVTCQMCVVNLPLHCDKMLPSRNKIGNDSSSSWI